MARTEGINFAILNGTKYDLSFSNVKYDKDDYESFFDIPKQKVASFQELTRHAEAYYYCKTVPFSFQVECNGALFTVEYDPYTYPYNGKYSQVKEKANDGWTFTCLWGPTGNRYDLYMIMVGTQG